MLQGSITKTHPFPLKHKLHCLIIRCYEGWFLDMKGLGVHWNIINNGLLWKWTWLLDIEGAYGFHLKSLTMGAVLKKMDMAS